MDNESKSIYTFGSNDEPVPIMTTDHLTRAIKTLLAIDGEDFYLNAINSRLASVGVTLTRGSVSLDYDDPQNNTPVENLIGSMK